MKIRFLGPADTLSLRIKSEPGWSVAVPEHLSMHDV